MYQRCILINWFSGCVGHILCFKLILTSSVNSMGGDRSRSWPEGSSFFACYPKVGVGATPIPVPKNTYPQSFSLCWALSREALSTIFQVFGMTRPGFEPRCPACGEHSTQTHRRCQIWLRQVIWKASVFCSSVFENVAVIWIRRNSSLLLILHHVGTCYALG